MRDRRIDADFAWVDGYLHAPLAGDPDPAALRDEAAAAFELGFDAEYVDAAPFVDRPGVRFPGQARIHPRKYLAGVARPSSMRAAASTSTAKSKSSATRRARSASTAGR